MSEQVRRQVREEQTGAQPAADALDDLAPTSSLVVAESVADGAANAALHVCPICGAVNVNVAGRIIWRGGATEPAAALTLATPR